MTTVREATYQVLRGLGMTTMFGNPGSTEETFLQGFPADMDYVLGLQEASVVAMADGYAQATGRPAVVQLHTAAGVGNAMGNISSAWHNRAPLIILTGQQTRQMLLLEPYLTNLRATELPRPYVKWSYETVRPQDAPAALIRAFAAAVQPPAGPVLLSVPMDDFDASIDTVPPLRNVSRRLGASPALLAETADALNAARSPVMLVGGAVDQSGGWDDAVRLAERLRCPVYSAPQEGRPGFPENHPQFQGAAPAAIGPLCEVFRGHDLVLVLGAPVFRYYPYVEGSYLPQGTRLIQITSDPEESARPAVGDSLLADPGLACAVLADLVSAPSRALPQPRSTPAAVEMGDKITAEFLFQAIEQLRPDDSIIVQESLSNLKALRQRIPTTAPGSFFSMASGVLGYGLPAAAGVALAEKQTGGNRKVICILGDGAAQYAIQGLWSAAQQRLPILYVIVRNSEYAILKSFAEQQDSPGVPGLDLSGIDSVRLAEGYGCTASRVGDPHDLEDALTEALSYSEGPHLLEVAIDPEVPPLI